MPLLDPCPQSKFAVRSRRLAERQIEPGQATPERQSRHLELGVRRTRDFDLDGTRPGTIDHHEVTGGTGSRPTVGGTVRTESLIPRASQLPFLVG